jgi:hypothetical protein
MESEDILGAQFSVTGQSAPKSLGSNFLSPGYFLSNFLNILVKFRHHRRTL